MGPSLILVDKPSGPTSHDIVYRARKLLGIKSIGHTGTLDPIASGLMILVIGEATKLSNYLMDGDKEYEVSIVLGARSNTYDREGVLSRSNFEIPNFIDIKNSVFKMSGTLSLKVPSFSAVKVDGKTLMERARKSLDVPEVFREMIFYEVEVLEYSCPNLKVRLRCNKGAYVRSWVEKLGDLLGCGAYVQELRRTENSGFRVENAYPLNSQANKENLLLSEAIIPIEKSLLHWPRIELAADEEKKVRNGMIPSDLAIKTHQLLLNSSTNHAFFESQNTQKLTCIVGLSAQKKVVLNRVFTY